MSELKAFKYNLDCSTEQVTHDRDINAAKNILIAGRIIRNLIKSGSDRPLENVELLSSVTPLGTNKIKHRNVNYKKIKANLP